MIKVEKLKFSYNDEPVLKDIHFQIMMGEFVGLIGPNGAGKSTLLKLLVRTLAPQTGQVFLHGRPLREYSGKELARQIGFVQQDFSSAFPFSAREVVLMGRFPHQKTFFADSRQDREIVRQAMEATDCYGLKERPFNRLSGGERQRVVLASALAQEPRILLLDEPTTALDLKHQVHFYDIITSLQRQENLTVLSVTHDVNLISRYCKRIMILKKGELLADGPVDKVMTTDTIEKTYDTKIQIISDPQSGTPVILSAGEK
jgi:iron complex transport system ATP-binding protein